MIVLEAPGSWILVAQADHATLSAGLMAWWRAGGLDRHERRDEILTAVREHDNGWLELDREPAWDPAAARPDDFMTEPADRRAAMWARGIDRAAREHGPFVGALVARHATALAEPPRRDTEPRFARLVSESGIDAAQLEKDYDVLRTGDVLSLVACGAWPAATLHDGRSARREGATLIVTPDPFAGRRVRYRVPARRIEARDYGTDRALTAAWAAAALSWIEGDAVGEVA